MILDNYGSHKHPNVRAWLGRHPRWTFHFIPTLASWLNAVEGFFAKLTRRRLKRGVFHVWYCRSEDAFGVGGPDERLWALVVVGEGSV